MAKNWLNNILNMVLPGVGNIFFGGGSDANNIANKVFGTGLTDAEKEANDFSASESSANRLFQAQQAEIDREFQAEQNAMYNSMSGKIAQAKEAGVNPMFAITGSASSPASASSHSPSGSVASSVSPTGGNIGSLISTILSAFRSKAEINLLNSEATRNLSEASKTDKETSWIDTYNTTNIESMKSGIELVKSNIDVNKQQVDESLQRVKESVKRMDKMDSEIEVNGALVDLHGSQKELNESRTAVEKMNAQHLQMLLPYIQARQEAEIALTNAKTDEAKYNAESHMYDANLKMLKVLVESKLVDSSYYDSVIDQAHWDLKYKKREYKWKPINDICHNISMIAIGAGSVASGGSSVISATKNVSDGFKNVATMNYF